MTVNDEAMTSILWRRLRYMLTPQFDLYHNIAPHLKGMIVLEVGFGTGFGTVQLAQHAKHILAIEPDGDACRFAGLVLPIPSVTWVCSDIVKHDNGTPMYDAVVMVETLEHIADWRKALENIHKLLKPDGCLYMTARNRHADLRRNDLHEREWTAKELKNALGEFFLDVKLYDYTLANEVDETTRITPLIAVARKAGGNEDSRSNLSKRWEQGSSQQTSARNVRQAAATVDALGSDAKQVSG